MQILSLITQCLILVCLGLIAYKSFGKNLSFPSFVKERGTLDEAIKEINSSLLDQFSSTTVNIHNMKVEEYQSLQATLIYFELPAQLQQFNGKKELRVDLSTFSGRRIYPVPSGVSRPFPRKPTAYEMAYAHQTVLEFPRPVPKKKEYTNNVIEVDFFNKQRKS